MLRAVFQQLSQSDFLRKNAVLFVGSLAVSVLNYAYYPVLGRMLGVGEYGEVQVLISLFLQLTIFLTVLGQVTINVVANGSNPKSHQVIFDLQRLGFGLSLLVFVVGVAGSVWLQNALQFASVWPFIVLLFALLATVPLTFSSAYLRGKQRFGVASVAGIVGAVTKLVFSALLVAIGFGTIGAIGGVLVAQVLALGYAAMQAKKFGMLRPAGARYFAPLQLKSLLPELKYSLFVLVASLAVTILSSIDIIMVKYFFSAETAGLYAGVSTVAKILFFLTASVAQVMLPAVKLQAVAKTNRLLFLKSLVLVGAIGGVALAVFALAPQFIIGLLMGEKYLQFASLLPMLSLAMYLVSVINLLVIYYVALRRYQVAAVVAVGVTLACGLVANGKSSLEAIVSNLALGCFGMLALFTAWRLARALKRKELVA